MVECCIEYLLHSLVSRVDTYAAELGVPCLVSCTCYSLEVPARELGGHVGARSFDADRRQSYLHKHLFSFGRIEVGLCEKRHIVNAVDLDVVKRLRELCIEINPLCIGPSF